MGYLTNNNIVGAKKYIPPFMRKRSSENKIEAFIPFINSFLSFTGTRSVYFLILSVITCLGQGIGIFMLIPAIRLFSDEKVTGNSNLITDALLKVLSYMHLPFTFATLLFFYFILTAFLKYITYRQNVLNMSMQNKFTSLLRCRLFNSIILSEWSFISHQKSSNIAHVLTSDIPRVSTGTFFFLKSVIGLVFTLSYIAWALVLSVKLTLIVIVIFSAVFIILKSYFPEAFSRNVKARHALSGIYTLLLDHLNGLKIAKSYCMENRECEEFEKLSDNISKTSIQSSIISSRASVPYCFSRLSPHNLPQNSSRHP